MRVRFLSLHVYRRRYSFCELLVVWVEGRVWLSIEKSTLPAGSVSQGKPLGLSEYDTRIRHILHIDYHSQVWQSMITNLV